MKDRSWHVELLEVLRKSRLREGLDAVIARFHPSHHPLQPPVLPDAFGNLCAGPVVSVERQRYVPIKLRPIFRILGSQVVEHRNGRTSGILVRIHHQRRHRADKHGHADTFRAVPSNVSSNFSAARGMAYMDRVLQVKLFCEDREIVSISVHIVTIPRLGGTAVTSPVMRDDSITLLAEEQHLSVPVVRGERPAVTENYGLALSPILVVNVRAVFCRERRHKLFSLVPTLVVTFSFGFYLQVSRLPPAGAIPENVCHPVSNRPEYCPCVFSRCAEPCRGPALFPAPLPWS